MLGLFRRDEIPPEERTNEAETKLIDAEKPSRPAANVPPKVSLGGVTSQVSPCCPPFPPAQFIHQRNRIPADGMRINSSDWNAARA